MPNLLVKIKKIILLLGDLGVFYLSLYLTLLIRYGYPVNPDAWQRHWSPFSLIFVAWLLTLFISDFYDLKISYNSSNLINWLIKIFLINGLMAVSFFYFFGRFFDTITPQKVLVIDLIITLIFIFVWRKIFYQFIKSAAIANRVLLIGQTPLAQKLAQEMQRRPQLGFQPTIVENMPEDLAAYCRERGINVLISANDLKNNADEAKKIFDCLPLGLDVYNIKSFYEQITNKIPVEYIEHDWFLENLSEHSKKIYEMIKRIADVVLALLGMIIALPLAPLIALIIKSDSAGPIFFKQIRTGKNGRDFLAVKFRSMVADAEKNGPQWAAKNDPRITRFGLIMRKTRIDEIPQLINILKGEMSFVGPRPERPEFIEILSREIPFYRERLLTRPGLTGWAQLNGPAYGGSQEETLEKLKYDLYYIKNRSLVLDFIILIKTIRVIISRKGQ